MALTASDLQKRHELEGAPDPFPSLVDSPVKSRPKAPARQELDTDSQTAFPSLAPSGPAASTNTSSAWGASAGPRIKASIQRTPTFADSFTLTAIDLSSSGKDGKPGSVGEVLKQVMGKYKVKIEASANQRTRQTTFHLKAESDKDLDRAKRSLVALLSPTISAITNAPASTIATIIGPKGSTLKQIRDQTNVRVDIPPKDSLPSVKSTNANGASNDDDDDEEPMVPITVTGPAPLVEEAQALLNAIISTKISKSTQRVRDIPANVLPFILARKALFESAASPETVSLSLNAALREISVSGERAAVTRVIESIKTAVEGFKGNLTSVKLTLPKRQHRLLSGKGADEILGKSKCAVITPKPEESSEDVVVWGQGADLPNGLAAVMERANSQYIHEFPLPGPISVSKQLLTYLTRIQYTKTLSNSHHGVSVYTPHPAVAEKASIINIDIIGEKLTVDNVVREVSGLIGKLIGATKEISVDWLLHRVIQGKHAKKIKQFHDSHNVLVFFPAETAEKSEILLVYDPLSPSASPSPDDKLRHLEEVAAEILKFAKDTGSVKSERLSVEKRWHEAVVGKSGTTLNAIIGEEKALSIKVGADVGDQSTEDVIVIRGASADVDRAVKEILQIIESAKNDEIVNSYSVEFEVEKEYVGHIVGALGAGVNKLRDQLGVKVDVSSEADDKEKEGGKKRKTAPPQKAKINITGRKENVEEAKKRILAQIDRLADETSEVLKIPTQYHSSLIGSSGKYAIRLEEKYSVKITFPRQSAENGESKTREHLKSDEVLIKGGKKGVAGAKSELLEAVEFEKESNNSATFTVPTRSIARIVGKAGASINEIKDDTGAQIDIDKNSSGKDASITVTGTKKAIAAAKAAILAIADQVGEETTLTVTIEDKYHRSLIGPGGQGLRDLISRVGGPSDARSQAGLIRFPRQGDASSDEVKLRGEPKLVNQLKAELEKAVAALRERVVLAVEVPASQHRAFIGRGGQHLNDLQNRHGVSVQFPGSRSYTQVGEPDNASEVKDTDPANVVKVSGPRPACEKAIEELKSQIKPPAPEAISATVAVPLKYHHAVLQQGALLRSLRGIGAQVEQSVQPRNPAVPPQPPTSGDSSTARIDDTENDSVPEAKWQVTSNYQDAEEGESQWTLKARDQTSLDKAQKIVKDAIAHAQRMTHVGFLTLPDRSLFPRIVGSKGSNVARLRNETGADITVSRENSTIVIIGSEAEIVAAKDAILGMNAGGPRDRRRD